MKKRDRHNPVRVDPKRIKITGKPKRYIDVDLVVAALVKIAAGQLTEVQPGSSVALDSDDLSSQDEPADHVA